jgi:hypothetical protein
MGPLVMIVPLRRYKLNHPALRKGLQNRESRYRNLDDGEQVEVGIEIDSVIAEGGKILVCRTY